MSNEQTLKIVIITRPDQLDQDWIHQLSSEADVGSVVRLGVLDASINLIRQTHPDLVIIDREVDETEMLMRQIFISEPGIVCIALADNPDGLIWRRLVTVGARDIVNRPLNYDELLQSIRSVVGLERNRQANTRTSLPSDPVQAGQGKFVVVISPKGGVGTTVVSTNLAILLRQYSSGRVALTDFGLQFGHIGTHLNIWSRHTLQELCARSDDIDETLLSGVMQQHDSGIHVLLAPNSPEVAGEITSEQLSRILDALLQSYSYVVADTWCVLDEITMALLSRADEVLVVATPEVPSLKNIKFFLDYLKQNEMTTGRVSIVLNRFPSVDGVSLEDVQQHLHHPVSANIPSAGQLVTYSVNRGVPIVVSHAQSWVADSLRKLAAYVAGEQVNPISLAPERGKNNRRADGKNKERAGFFRTLRRNA